MDSGQGTPLRGEASPPVHPGKVIKREYFLDLECTQKVFALRLGVKPSTVSELFHGVHSITPEIALKLEKLLGTPATMWLHAQTDYDLAQARLAERSVSEVIVVHHNGHHSSRASKDGRARSVTGTLGLRESQPP